MAEVILMPRLSDTMTEGVIASWHKKIGDTVQKGDLLAEIETDKATMELESYQNGTLLHIGTPNGGKLQVNDLLAIIGQQGEDVTALVARHSGGGAATEIKPAPAAAQTTAPAPAAPAIDPATMEEVVLMPRLSDTMTEGVIASWHKKVGDAVKKGDVLADIETDKATMELESYKDGILLHQGAAAGATIRVNDLLCIIGKESLDVAAILAALQSSGAPSASAPQPAASTAAPVAAPAAANNTAVAEQATGGRIFASPLAKKMAADMGIDLSKIKGFGNSGRS